MWPLLPKQVCATRARLKLAGDLPDLALFKIANDHQLHGSDLLKLVSDMASGERVVWFRTKLTPTNGGIRATHCTATKVVPRVQKDAASAIAAFA